MAIELVETSTMKRYGFEFSKEQPLRLIQVVPGSYKMHRFYGTTGGRGANSKGYESPMLQGAIKVNAGEAVYIGNYSGWIWDNATTFTSSDAKANYFSWRITEQCRAFQETSAAVDTTWPWFKTMSKTDATVQAPLCAPIRAKERTFNEGNRFVDLACNAEIAAMTELVTQFTPNQNHYRRAVLCAAERSARPMFERASYLDTVSYLLQAYAGTKTSCIATREGYAHDGKKMALYDGTLNAVLDSWVWEAAANSNLSIAICQDKNLPAVYKQFDAIKDQINLSCTKSVVVSYTRTTDAYQFEAACGDQGFEEGSFQIFSAGKLLKSGQYNEQ